MKKKALIFLGVSVLLQLLHLVSTIIIIVTSSTWSNLFIGATPSLERIWGALLVSLLPPFISTSVGVLLFIVILILSKYNSTNRIAEVIGTIFFGGFHTITSSLVGIISAFLIRNMGTMYLAYYSTINSVTGYINFISIIAFSCFIIGCVTMFIYKKQLAEDMRLEAAKDY